MFAVLYLLFCLPVLALLEFNKNTVWGWLLTLAVLCVYPAVRKRFFSGRKLPARLLAFAGLVALRGAVLILTVGPVKRRPAVAGDSPAVTDIVTVSQGKLTGVLTSDGAVEVYAGIPYAKPPVGPLRWKEPEDPEPWEGVFAADHFGPMAMQTTNPVIVSSLTQLLFYHDYEVTLGDSFRDEISEDALYLNIWKPAGARKDLPVLVYIHGGSLQTGQPWYADYSGEGLARRNVVVVNMGYRLGVFGFLAAEELRTESPAGTTGNYGLLDQIKALEWVRDNIAAFGGDPNNVTLAGESAGSACVSALCTSPLAKGLFRRAIGESSSVTAREPAHSFRSLDEALAVGRETMERFGAATIEELRAVDAKKLVAAADANHHMTVDGYVLPCTPHEAYSQGVHNEEALLHGFNSEESAAFLVFNQGNLKNYEERIRTYFGEYTDEVLALYPAETDEEARENWAKIYAVVFFPYGHYCWNRQAAENGIPVYEYYFTRHNGRLGPWHSGEEVYCYGNIPEDSRLYDAYDRTLSEIFSSYFVNFAATGDPNGEGLPLWEINEASDTLLELGDTVGPVKDPYLSLYEILDRVQNGTGS